MNRKYIKGMKQKLLEIQFSGSMIRFLGIARLEFDIKFNVRGHSQFARWVGDQKYGKYVNA